MEPVPPLLVGVSDMAEGTDAEKLAALFANSQWSTDRAEAGNYNDLAAEIRMAIGKPTLQVPTMLKQHGMQRIRQDATNSTRIVVWQTHPQHPGIKTHWVRA